MKRLALRGFVLMLACAGCTDSTPQTFSSQSGNFRVTMPGAPKEEAKSQPTPIGPLVMNIFSQRLNDGTEYAVMYADYPDQIVLNSSPERMLDGAANGTANGVGSRIVSSAHFDFSGHPGVEFETVSSATPSRYGRCKLFLVRNRLYQLFVLGASTSSIRNETAEGFFTSFALLNEVSPLVATRPASPPIIPQSNALAQNGEVSGTIGSGVDEPNVPKPTYAPKKSEPPPQPAQASTPKTMRNTPATIASKGLKPKISNSTNAAGAKVLSFKFVNETEDQAARMGGSDPDGEPDVRVQVDLELPQNAQIDSIAVTAGAVGHWTTLEEGGHWPITVFNKGQEVARKHKTPVGDFSGKQTFDLYFPKWRNAKSGDPINLRIGLSINGSQVEIQGRCLYQIGAKAKR